MKLSQVTRIRLVAIGVTLLALLFLARLFFLQVIKSADYTDMADRQYLRPAGGMFDRGSIFFQDKDGNLVSAARLAVGYFVTINPTKITQPEEVYTKLNKIVPLDHATFMAKATKAGDTYEELAHRLTEGEASAVTALDLPGVYLYKEQWRTYPYGEEASHVLGFMGFNGDVYQGRYGLEKQFDTVLTRNGGLSFVNFFAEIFSGLGKTLLHQSAAQEGDLVLTIDPTVQNYLEKQLDGLMTDYHPEVAGGIIMDPKTGEIYAMGTTPNFDPNTKQDSVAILGNPMVSSVYEMGSIFKPLTMAGALEVGAVKPTTTYDDKGYVIVNNKKIENFDHKGRGVINMQMVLDQSLNTGAVFAEQKMGNDAFRRYMLNYGIGEKTGIDLPDEASGLVNNLQSPRDVEYATAAFGQGVAVTPIEITRALASLGNGGYLVTPHVVKSIRYQTMATEDIKPTIQRQVLKNETSAEITKMLVEVVDSSLAGGNARLPHYTIAAKTGTAQVAGPDGKYYSDEFLHSFFGYFPANNPKFIVFLYMKYPKGVSFASLTLTHPFVDITKFLLSYYEVPPDR